MIQEVDKQRWDVAQESEKEYWMQWETESLRNYLEEVYKTKLEVLLKRWEKYIKIKPNIRILQIGCGPLDIINYFKVGKRYSIDPLADFYKNRFKIDYKASNLKQAPGEEIPFPDKYFDLVIIDNVLDHTHLPEKVLAEINRVLKNRGIMHLEVQIYQERFLIASKIWGFFKKLFTGEIFNIHHPHMFRKLEIERLIGEKYDIMEKELEDLDKLKREREKQKFTSRFSAKLGLLGNINYMFICKKKPISN